MTCLCCCIYHVAKDYSFSSSVFFFFFSLFLIITFSFSSFFRWILPPLSSHLALCLPHPIRLTFVKFLGGHLPFVHLYQNTCLLSSSRCPFSVLLLAFFPSPSPSHFLPNFHFLSYFLPLSFTPFPFPMSPIMRSDKMITIERT